MISKMFKDFRIMLVLVAIVLSFFSIHPSFQEGIKIVGVSTPASFCLETDSIITKINEVEVKNMTDYISAIGNLEPNTPIRIYTIKQNLGYIYSAEKECAFIASLVNNETYIGVQVEQLLPVKLEFGTELVGGVKVFLQPEKELTENDVELTINILSERLNVYGIKEIPINYLKDFSGNQFFQLEFAGTTEDQVQSLLQDEGVFEAQIGNETVFTGQDLRSVCVSGVDCTAVVMPAKDQNGNTVYRYSLGVLLTQEAADNFAEATKNLKEINSGTASCYLNDTINFFIDGIPMEGGQLSISCSLKGVAEIKPQLTGVELTEEEAFSEMKRMQALLQSTKLPVKLNIVRTETVSPNFGKTFAINLATVFLMAIIAVDLVIALRYRNPKIILPIIFVTLSEIFITLGVASAIRWTIDFAGIAGIIASVGTGVNDQIVITDEVLRGEKKNENIKRNIKSAFFIIVVAFVTSLATMLPLAFAGAGIFRGFAITTIIATSVGIFITRPAYGRILEFSFRKR